MIREHITYKIKADMNVEKGMYFYGIITYFDGEDIIFTKSEIFKEREDAWKWIAGTLKAWKTN